MEDEAEFNWEEYLEETGAEAAPHTTFRHVCMISRSLFNPVPPWSLKHSLVWRFNASSWRTLPVHLCWALKTDLKVSADAQKRKLP